MTAAAATSPRLRLAEALLAQSRAEEAERLLLPLASAKDAATLAAMAPLHLAAGRFDGAPTGARTALASGPMPARMLVAVTGTLAWCTIPRRRILVGPGDRERRDGNRAVDRSRATGGGSRAHRPGPAPLERVDSWPSMSTVGWAWFGARAARPATPMRSGCATSCSP